MQWYYYRTPAIPKSATHVFTKSNTPILFDRNGLVIRWQTAGDIEHTNSTFLHGEGWSSLLHAWPAIHSLDPQGFYMLEQNGEQIASVSMVTYPDIHYAYIGMYVVAQEFRSQGLGRLLFETVLAHTQHKRNIHTFGLNCFANMAPLYSQWNFLTNCQDVIWRLIGPINLVCNDLVALETLDTHMLSMLLNYDQSVLGLDRSIFLKNFITKPNTMIIIAQQDDRVQGFCIINQRVPAKSEPQISYRISPMYAENLKIAKELLQRAIAAINLQPDEAIFIDVPAYSDITPYLVDLGFATVASMDKMYRGTPPNFATSQMFGYTSLAFGC